MSSRAFFVRFNIGTCRGTRFFFRTPAITMRVTLQQIRRQKKSVGFYKLKRPWRLKPVRFDQDQGSWHEGISSFMPGWLGLMSLILTIHSRSGIFWSCRVWLMLLFFGFFFFFFSTNQQAQQNISLITKLFFHLTVFLVIVVIKFLLSIFSPTFLDRTLRCCLLRVPRSSPGRPQVPTIVKRIKLLSIIMRSWQADRADL